MRNFQPGQFYRLLDHPEDFYTHGMAEFAGQLVRLEKFENLHCGVLGARVGLPDGTGGHWVALTDLCGDNILWDTYSALLECLAAPWLAGAVQGGTPLEYATFMVSAALQGCYSIRPQLAPAWLEAVIQEIV